MVSVYQKIKNNHSGFSLAELMISAAIIGLISAMVIANFRGSTQRFALDNESERLESVIREAHINSLIGLTVAGARPPGGFGLHLETCQSNCRYGLYADLNDDYVYLQSADGVPLQSIGMLDDNVYIADIVFSPSGNSPDILDINFVPPQGTVYFNGSAADAEVSVTLGFTNNSYRRTLTINRLTGQISIN